VRSPEPVPDVDPVDVTIPVVVSVDVAPVTDKVTVGVVQRHPDD
jgi:hypothetical protein